MLPALVGLAVIVLTVSVVVAGVSVSTTAAPRAAVGDITTVAGGGSLGDSGPATSASLARPPDMAVDATGNLFIADRENNRLRRVDAATGVITTVAGGWVGDGGPATSASLNSPRGVAMDPLGNLFIADSINSRIRRVDAATEVITTVVGTGTNSFSGDGGPATSAKLSQPRRVVESQEVV